MMEKYVQAEEDKDLGEDTSVMSMGVHTEGFEGGEDDEDGGPAVIQ